MAGERYPHIKLNENFRTPLAYTRRPPNIQTPPQERSVEHGQQIRRKFDEAWTNAGNQTAVGQATRDGVYLEFVSEPAIELMYQSLEDMASKKVRVVNVRKKLDSDNNERTYATIYVSNDKRSLLSNKLEAYLVSDTPGGAPKNGPLVNSIGDIKAALLESFWTDSAPMPDEEPEFVEIWINQDSDEAQESFESSCGEVGIELLQGQVSFPERRVFVGKANSSQLEALYQCSGLIAEFRLAKETAAFWLQLQPAEQAEWAQDLRQRMKIDEDSKVSICILDTGVNKGHPLISPLLSSDDQQAFDSAWGSDDHNGHGTLMAGVAAFGDLKAALESGLEVKISHRLESVKILPPRGSNPKRLYGHVTSQAISLATIQANDRKRIYCLAVTATDDRDRGRPSSWSGFVDQSAFGSDDGVEKLFVISAGNTPLGHSPDNYPNEQVLESIQDPAQAWNALTVGAYTDLVEIRDDDYRDHTPLAPQGGLSPYSSCSTEWEKIWPIKPDVVFEGGNLAVGNGEVVDYCDELCLLSTHHRTTERLFEGFAMTSAACAKAAWFAAQIQSRYPELWPETIRAILVHSAEWTLALKQQFLRDPDNPSKGDIAYLARISGWGVPDLNKALHSTANSLTLISEATLQPYQQGSSGYKTKDWHLYSLPWPKDVLLELPPETEVSMRVTLSYFIEPGPGEVGWKDRYKYPSHGLRFGIKKPGESELNFKRRISEATESDSEIDVDRGGAGDYWTLGSTNRHKGSIHSDIWKGSPQDLANSNILAVYPIKGWWAQRQWLNRGESKCRYSFLVSISTPNEEIDFYIPISTQIGVPTPVEITI
ncbi:S8 family peptidase [Pelagicoccus sp. SDUM812002]|uniref:S8 family peptidase n=1 Tax=Pelagicoccus sp. SDUM812002 TaxID=3041266 RepID=UPI0028106250|nr:S8 family peptidase [Pelagicoccus sp. SDUM812002]MDQ8185809.1 S8 family peptidase [Pelagicoccus sp. SDUM812002]